MENGGEDCCVKVAVHVRPLIAEEKLQGCKDCVSVVPGKPQVQLGTHSFTFNHVYGSTGSPSSAMFEECVAPLVDGLFQGYNATVLAYGQTGSGKTYTMGTGGKDDDHAGLIPQVMDTLFNKVENLKHQADFQFRVSFIEILKEEVRDLLDPAAGGTAAGNTGKVAAPAGKGPVQIRETSTGAITLTGSTEVDVQSQKEMVACLEQGSLNRATGSTNMNSQSSRSHAIFTIMLEQMRKVDLMPSFDGSQSDDMIEDYFSAKLHLVDLAGSERAKRTGSDGMRFKEGVHINRGLLSLGNVISALGDEKKRKEGAHVPYRDSKLTRLLQDSLGGNSRTVMIACISPADINAEETLNTLKYANRARNIQNKPIVNRSPLSAEIQKLRQQIGYLQAELLSARGGGGSSSDEIQLLKDRISRLEAANKDLRKELNAYHSQTCLPDDCQRDIYENGNHDKEDGTRDDVTLDCLMAENIECDNIKEADEEVEKEWEHNILQDSMGKELNELNRRLEQKQSEMKIVGGLDMVAIKHHFGKKLLELEDEKRIVQQERDRLMTEVESLAHSAGEQTHKLPDIHAQKLKSLEAQILDLKKKQENQVMLLKQKQKSEEAARKLQDEIQYIKAQKVQLQHKIKQEAEQFRQWKASREKELLQLKKEGRKNEYERHKLQALNQRQKLVLQRKTEEAAMATKRLKELLETRKPTSRESSMASNGSSPIKEGNEKSLQKWLEHELEVMVHVHEVRSEYEKQSKVRAALAEELAILKQSEEMMISKGQSPPKGKNGFSRILSMPQNARIERVASLENMVSISSNTLVAMASQLSEAEERERVFTSRGRWNQLRSMTDTKNLLQHIFNVAVDARCQLREKEIEIKELKGQLNELVILLQLSEARRKEIEKQQNVKEQQATSPMVTPPSTPANTNGSLKHDADDSNPPSSPVSLPALKQLKYTPGIVNSPSTEKATFMNQDHKMVPVSQVWMGRKSTLVGQSGRLWRWKRSHHQWLLQFKWKWQKPWKLSQWIRNSDVTLRRPRPRPLLLRRT